VVENIEGFDANLQVAPRVFAQREVLEDR